MKKSKAQIVYLPPELIQKVQDAARKNYRSISGEVAFVLEQHYQQQERKPQDQ
jgi:hypothetical protein